MASHPSNESAVTPLEASTPLNGIVAIRPHVETLRCPPPPPKSSSERGRAYRARRKQREAAKLQYMADLIREIDELTRRKTLMDATRLQQRHTLDGSLCRLIETYYELFGHGFVDAHGSTNAMAMVRAERQREFVFQTHDEYVSLGSEQPFGPSAVLLQWQLYTAAHPRFLGTVESMEVQGSIEDPIIVVKGRVLVSIGRCTFEIMFPHVLGNQRLQDRLIGQDVVYESTTRFRFTAADRICSEECEMNLISGLQRTGIGLSDVALLMQTPTVSAASMISIPRQDDQPHTKEETNIP